MDKIFSGNDRARELGKKDYRELIAFLAAHSGSLPGITWNGAIDEDPKKALTAFIDAGRWAATCECGESCWVEPLDPIMFCMVCKNVSMDHKARAVIFPGPIERATIEAALLERQVIGHQRTIARLGTQMAGFPGLVAHEIPRNWDGQSVAELHVEAKRVREISKEIKEQKKVKNGA